MSDCFPLLASVSRSFYLSMRFLPSKMRPSICLAYLLARATDSVADTAKAELPERLFALNVMDEVICGDANDSSRESCRVLVENILASSQEHHGERELLGRFLEITDTVETLPKKEQELIKTVLHIIMKGQRWDLTYFQPDAPVVPATELTRYTYQVAGCVGEFWTQLTWLTQGNRCSYRSKEEMMDLGRRFGQGLQLVNILRDVEEDALRGRRYIDELWSASYQARMDEAQTYLQDGLMYARALRDKRLRFAVALPALIGMETLELLSQRTAAQQHGKVKVSRRRVKVLMLKALLYAWLNLRG